MSKEFPTLADTVKDWGELPKYLQFEEDPEKTLDKVYESIYDEKVSFRERQNTRKSIRAYIAQVPEESRSWDKFNEGYNTYNINKLEYARAMELVKIGVINNNSRKDRIYESIYNEGLRLNEAKGLRPVIRKYLANVPEEQRSWEKFNADGFNTVDIKESDYNREMVLVGKGVYGLRNDLADEDEDLNPEDTRPDFDPDDPMSDPILASIYRVQQKTRSETADAAVTVARKYKTMYNTVKAVASSQSLNCHAFICGEGGIGKCVSYDTPVTVCMDDDTAKDFESWLKSHQE